jgi:hypothetical protein
VERGELNEEREMLLNRLNWILKSESLTIDGIDEIKGKIRLRVWNDTTDHKEWRQYGYE